MEVLPLGELTTDQALDFTRGSGVLPYDYYPVPREGLEAYAADQLAAAASMGRGTVAEHQGAKVACVYQDQPWDREQLGRSAGRISALVSNEQARRNPSLAASLTSLAIHRLDEEGMAGYVAARQDARNTALIQGLEAMEFYLVDGLLKFSLSLRETVDVPVLKDVVMEQAVPDDIPALRALAAQGFIYDRFHNDPEIPNETADALHAAWVENGARGKTGCGVLVARCRDAVAGFFLLAEDTRAREFLGFSIGTLVLIAVDPRFRRRGIARALSLASAAYLAERGHQYAEVGTQMANMPASKVYLSSGFNLVQSQFSLRRAAPL